MQKHSSGCVYLSKEEVAGVLAQAPVQGKKLMEPLKTLAIEKKLPINLLEDHEVSDNKAEVHTLEHDLWLCLEGEGRFIYGGEMHEPFFSKGKDGTEKKHEIRAYKIIGGAEVAMKPGDWLWVPAGVPHWHGAIKTARYAIIKIPAK